MSNIVHHLAHRKDREEGSGTNAKAIPFNQQDFRTLREQAVWRRALQSGALFCDLTFPAEAESLGYNELGRYSSKTRGVEWKRPTEICRNPQFNVGGAAKRIDICQGDLGDCWLLAAIASLTLDKDILARVVPKDQSFQVNYAGIFHFQFWRYGEWVDVVIDDRLPVRDGKLLFVHSAEGDFWSALLEKAYAKVSGCYESLNRGNTMEGFEDFTGGIAEKFDLSKDPPFLYKIMKKALGLGSLLGCSIYSDPDTEAKTTMNLWKGHAYSVTAAEVEHLHESPVQLVRIRNPWGHTEWTGAWSSKSSKWDDVRPEEAKLNVTADNGEFWMAYSDFTCQFSRLEICNLTPDALTSDEVGRWNHYQFEGTWEVGSTAGGCKNYTATFCSNPQFFIHLKEVDDDPHDEEDGCSFLVGLMQKDMRREKMSGHDFNTIGYAIYQVPDKYKGRSNIHLGPDVLLQQRPVAETRIFKKRRERSCRYKLLPGEYVIVPSTREPHCKGSFVLRVFSEKHAATRWSQRS
ncbi:calpain-2 catalytic subunit-like [Clupea harengus]|uniref:Calpain-2 catalytic subunit-like n=1 Tax=Clupea harengus TaxID=7950 RepID=A0A6P8F2U4_CLUHA|nr:calpain-2 catalytic subunit-like [Clupea harengus]